MSSLPTYDQLPIDSKYPSNTAWGLWGENDNLGTLNKITQEITAKASQCVKRGQVFALNWEMEKPYPTLLGRDSLKHTLVPLLPNHLAFDDKYDTYNPQTSSQWDGFRHFGLLSAGKFYNNVDPSELAPVDKETAICAASSEAHHHQHGDHGRLGIHHFARRGIATRAVLLDYARWAAKHRPDFDPFQPMEITVDELDQVAKAQNVTFRQGDILLLRIGWTAKHDQLLANGTIKDTIPDPANVVSAGIKACQETFAWLWNHHFAACASDNVALEVWPPADWATSCRKVSPDESLKSIKLDLICFVDTQLLGGWGMHIGELFYLDELAESSAKDGVYEYFFTSAPLNKFKGVASPPNALCIK
ncbi:hypothetical protein DFQ28_009989 [Apophysomyces sp. BC1034]|nr:hypothetical protein DFQ30_009653 [Apophysomyces sp. BC1015]KAG0173946.1 hypothetical protein DFQ29_007671 [Apophysomyces sp. BC1021]KAG0185069.1 hypothetical protein DFQ28_009989 [Apophysomyces sp. BC1034]